MSDETAMPLRVRVFEVGPRDGLQNLQQQLSVEQKLELIARLAQAGLTDIEIGSFVHPRWVPQMKETDEVARRLPESTGVRFWSLVPNIKGFERALEAGARRISVVMSATRTHNEKNLNRSRAQSLAEIEEIAREAASRELPVRAYLSTAFGCPYEGRVPESEIVRLCEMLLSFNVAEISLGDTIGSGSPGQVAAICRRVLVSTGPARLGVHLHDTRGLGLANAYAALQEGVRTLDSSVGGTGGCPYAPGAAGNIGTEDLINMLDGLGIETGVDVDGVIKTTRWLRDSLGIEPSSKYFAYRNAACGVA